MPTPDRRRWAALSPLLDELLGLDAAARRARLEQLRAGDTELAAELRALLADADALDADGFLEGSALAPPADGLRAGRVVGAYTLERPLGAGGMGSVWLARRSDGRFDGVAAIKLPHPGVLTQGGAERFAREARLLGRLAHPNIAALLDAGVAAADDDGAARPFLVLEHVDGEPIDRWCDARTAGIDERVRLFLDVLAAVAHAHGKLVLHRDLKPSNILVTAEGRVKLLDFGIARLLRAPAAADGPAAPTAAIFTPDHAAPEQVLGGELTTATDVYALGVLLYQLLSGRHPTTRPTQGRLERLRAVVETDPPRLSDTAGSTPLEAAGQRAATPPQLARRLRGDLDNIVAKALKKAPEERYASVAEFAADLRRYLQHEPVSARADSLGYRAGRFARRHRVGLAATAAVALALVVGVVGTAWQAREAAQQRDLALLRLQRERAATEFVDLMIFGTWGNDERISQKQFLARSESLALRQLRARPEEQSVVLNSLGSYHASLGDQRQAEALLRRAVGLLTPSTDRSWRAAVECNHASMLGQLGDAAAARPALERWIADPRVEPAVAVQCEMYLAQLAQTGNDAPGALRHALAAQRRLTAAGADRAELLQASLHGELGYGYAMNDRFDDADRHYAAAIRAYRQAGQGESPAVVAILNNWSIVHWRAGDAKRALAMLDEVVAIAGQRGSDGAPPAFVARNRANALVALGRYAQAIEAADLAIAATAATSSAAEGMRPLVTKIEAATESGDFAAAQRWLDTAEALARTLPEGSFDANQIPLGHARLALRQGRPAAAREGLAPLIAALGDPKQGNAALAYALRLNAEAALALGQPALARPDAQTALALGQRLQGGRPLALRTGKAWLLLAQIDQVAGDAAAARADADRALEHLRAMLDAGHPDLAAAEALRGL